MTSKEKELFRRLVKQKAKLMETVEAIEAMDGGRRFLICEFPGVHFSKGLPGLMEEMGWPQSAHPHLDYPFETKIVPYEGAKAVRVYQIHLEEEADT